MRSVAVSPPSGLSLAGSTTLPHFVIALVAAGIGAGVVVAPGAVAGGLCVFLVIVLWLISAKKRAYIVLAALAVVPVIAGIARYGGHASSGLSYVDDVALAFGFPILALAIDQMQAETKKLALAVVALLAVGEAIGMVDSHGGWKLGFEAAWQDLRWLGAVGWGLHLARSMSPRQRFASSYYLLMGWNVLQAAVAFTQIALGQGSEERFSIPVVKGLLGHPTLGAIAGTVLLVLVLTDAVSPTSLLSGRQRTWGAGVAFTALIVSTRFKPLLAVGGVLLFCLAKRVSQRRWPSVVALVATPLFFFATIPVASELSQRSRSDNTVINITAHAVPRVALIDGARKLAANAFPFGWGLGTYGSNLDKSLESATFSTAGLGNTYGFSNADPSFRFDSLLAHVLAERGWAGMVIWMSALVGLMLLFMRLGGAHLFPAGLLVAALSMAPVTSSFNDGAMALIMFLPATLCLGAGEERVFTDISEASRSARLTAKSRCLFPRARSPLDVTPHPGEA
jgi:hypothetical protein